MAILLIIVELLANLIFFILINKAIKQMKNRIDIHKVIMYLCIQLTILEIYFVLYPLLNPSKWVSLRSNELVYILTIIVFILTFFIGLITSLKFIKFKDASYLISGFACLLISSTGFILYLYHFIHI